MNSMMFMREDGQMGTCKICGKNFGLMGGGSEPYTGHNLQVCNSCGEVLKKIDKVKNEDTQEVKDLFVSVMSMTDDADVKQILTIRVGHLHFQIRTRIASRNTMIKNILYLFSFYVKNRIFITVKLLYVHTMNLLV